MLNLCDIKGDILNTVQVTLFHAIEVNGKSHKNCANMKEFKWYNMAQCFGDKHAII